MAPKPASKPSVLSAEAAAMEQKLADLRKAMEKERAKRDALMANAGGGPIWRNGASLRPNIAKGGDASRRPASGTSTSGPAPPPGRAPASARSGSSAGEAAAESVPPSVSGSRVASARAARGSTPDSQAGGGGGSGGGGGGVAGGGMSCGTDDGPTLGAGAFSEADSHRSFLDALNEWRRANRGDVADGAGPSQDPPAVDSGPGLGRVPRASARVSSSNLEVQTETQPASRPSSAKPLSYFEKLVLNTTSRQAGHLAAGGAPDSLRPSISGQPESRSRPASAATSRPTSAAIRSSSAATASTPAASSAPAEAEAAALRASSDSNPSDPFSILDRLEALERQRQTLQGGDDDDEDLGTITVTTATGMVLTKGVRLPDEVLMPPCNVGC